MSKKVDLSDVVFELRQLLDMSREELLREAKFTHEPSGRMKKSNILIYVLERKFNKDIRDPTIAQALAAQEGWTNSLVRFGKRS